MTTPPDRLLLASRSPQRRAILDQLGICFDVIEVDVDELDAGDPVEVVRANALAKARAGARQRPHATVLGVDTVVVLDGEIFGKPASAAEAHRTLQRLAGRTHEVLSGLAVLGPANPQVVHEVTKVTFRTLADDAIGRYVKTGEWCDRAGGYAIQGQGAALVRAICGDYLNVVGLPIARMLDLDLRLRFKQG